MDTKLLNHLVTDSLARPKYTINEALQGKSAKYIKLRTKGTNATFEFTLHSKGTSTTYDVKLCDKTQSPYSLKLHNDTILRT